MVVVRYAQAPVGWWQDPKGTMQPPGSFLSPSSRVPLQNLSAVNNGSASHDARGRLKKWVETVLHRRT